MIIRLLGDGVGDVLDVMADESGKLAQALANLGDRYPYLSCIDQYGVTVFNRLRARVLLAEIDRVRSESQFTLLAGVLNRLADLVEQYAQEVHLFLWAEGD